MNIDIELNNIPDLAIDNETIGGILILSGKNKEGKLMMEQVIELYQKLGLPKEAQRAGERLGSLMKDNE